MSAHKIIMARKNPYNSVFILIFAVAIILVLAVSLSYGTYIAGRQAIPGTAVTSGGGLVSAITQNSPPLAQSPYGEGGCGWYGVLESPGGEVVIYCGTASGYMSSQCFSNLPPQAAGLSGGLYCGGECPPGEICSFGLTAGTVQKPKDTTPCRCIPAWILTAQEQAQAGSAGGQLPCRNTAKTGAPVCGGSCPLGQTCEPNNLGAGYPCVCI